MMRALKLFRRHARDEGGSATIPFVMALPLFITMIMAAYEIGYYAMTSAMLDRGLTDTMRDIRLGRMKTVTLETLKPSICDYASYVPNCRENILVELRPITAQTFAIPSTMAQCVDRNAAANPITIITNGGENELMLVQVCVLFDPVFPTTWLSGSLHNADGNYAIVSVSGFVNEPQS